MKKILLALLLFMSVSASGGNLTPILMTDGNQQMVCDGQMRFMNTVSLTNKTIVGSYLFANLVTSGGGADIVIWSPVYGGWGTIGDLHIFHAINNGNRQGERERMFPAGDGIYIENGIVQIAAICWGGGYAEIYAQIWVK